MKAPSGLITLRGFLLFSVIALALQTMAEGTQTGGTVQDVNRGSKREWPEVVGLAVEEAEEKIKADKPQAVLQVLLENSFVTMDFNQRRVRIFVDEFRKVARTPRVG